MEFLLSDSSCLNSPTLREFQASSCSVVDILETHGWSSELNNILVLHFKLLCHILLKYLIYNEFFCHLFSPQKNVIVPVGILMPVSTRARPRLTQRFTNPNFYLKCPVNFCQHFVINNSILKIIIDGKIPYFSHSSLYMLCLLMAHYHLENTKLKIVFGGWKW